jgi:hypothetical protein
VIALNQSKKKTAARDFALAADFLMPETIIFFSGECFATPVSLCFVPGFHNL